MKLTGEEVQKAWDDYKEFLEVTKQYVIMNRVQVEQAFRMGFSHGYAADINEINVAPVIEIPVTEKLIRATRRYRVMRTRKEILRDQRAVFEILKVADKPMQLCDIIIALEKQGIHWDNKNGSGHMRTIMDGTKRVKRISRGFYQYVEGAKRR